MRPRILAIQLLDPAMAVQQGFALLDQACVPERLRAALRVTLDEAVDNIVRHVWRNGACSRIRLALKVSACSVRMTVTDDGPPFDPTAPAALPGADAIGGRGLVLIHHLADRLCYRRIEAGNELSIVMRRDRRLSA